MTLQQFPPKPTEGAEEGVYQQNDRDGVGDHHHGARQHCAAPPLREHADAALSMLYMCVWYVYV